MSSVHGPNHKSTDFTIARILGNDSIEHTKIQNISLVKNYLPLDVEPCSSSCNYSNTDSQCSLNNTNNRDSVKLSRVADSFLENKIIVSSSKTKIFKDNEDKEKNINKSSLSNAQSANDLYWLQCTRFRPPKLPRKSFAGRESRRRSATHPRVPFTSCQLQVLEDKYKRNAYLSRTDVMQLSTALRISHNRIKIWFQNRRARDKREIKVTSNISMEYKDKK